MKRRMQYKKDNRKISLRKGEDSNLKCSIAVISEGETTNVYWNEQDVLTLESKQRNMIIKKQDIKKLEFGQLFIYQIVDIPILRYNKSEPKLYNMNLAVESEGFTGGGEQSFYIKTYKISSDNEMNN